MMERAELCVHRKRTLKTRSDTATPGLRGFFRGGGCGRGTAAVRPASRTGLRRSTFRPCGSLMAVLAIERNAVERAKTLPCDARGILHPVLIGLRVTAIDAL